MAGQQYLIPIRILLDSNVAEFRATFQRELRAMETSVASRASTGPNGTQRTPRAAAASAQGQLASIQAQSEQQIEAIRPQIGNDIADRAVQSVRTMIAQAHEGIQQGLRSVYGKDFKVPLPTQQQVQREAARPTVNSAAEAAAARELAARAARQAENEARAQSGRAVGGRTLSHEGVQAYRGMLAGREGADIALRAGQTGALDTQLGRVTGIFQELELARPEVQQTLVTLRATLSSLQKYRNTIENAATEQAITNRLLSDESDGLVDATGDLARARRQRQLIERGIGLDATKDLVPDEGALAARQRERRLAIEREKIGATTDEQRAGAVATNVARQKEAAQIGESTARASFQDKELQEAKAREILAREKAARAVNSEVGAARRIGVAQGSQDRGTWFQRVQQWMAQRQGGPSRPAQDYQRAGQFFGSRAITTAGFAASGAALYGGINFAGDVLKESEQLQQQMSIIKSQFNTVQQSGDKISFERFRKELQGVALDANTAADEVAFVSRQLAGAFADEKGRPNFSKGLQEAEVSLGYSKLSGFPTQEINDSLTSIALAFRDENTQESLPFERILDQATYLENKLGVLSQETIKFVADLAPLGKELGFTYEQLAGIGAVAQQSSGRSGAALSEQFGRILPFIQQNKADILGLYGQKKETQDAIPDLAEGFARGDIPGVLANIIKYYDKLDATQKNVLGDMLGGQRNAAALFAVLNRAPQALQALEEGPKGEGSFEKRMEEYRKTVGYSFERMRREAEKLGNTLYNAGIADGLTSIAQAGQLAFKVVDLLVTGFSQLNQAAGGFPGRAVVVLASLKAMQKLVQAMATTDIGKGIIARLGLQTAQPYLASQLAGATQLNGTGQALGVGALLPTTLGPGGVSYGRFGAFAAGAMPGQFGSPYAASGRMKFGVQAAQRIPGLRGMLNTATPGMAAASGGALAAGAPVAGMGTAFAGGLATAGVTVGLLIAGQQLQSFLEKRAAVRKEARDATEGAIVAMTEAVKQGLSRKELIRVFDKSVEDTSLRRGSKGDPREGGNSARDKAFTESLNRGILADQKQLYQDQIEQVKGFLDEDRKGSDAALRAVFDRQKGSNLSDLSQDSELGKLLLNSKAGYKGSYGQVEYRDTDITEVVEKVRKYLLDNPEDASARVGVEQMIQQIVAAEGPGSPLAVALKKLQAEFDASKRKKSTSSNVRAALDDLEATEADYQAYMDNFRYEIEFSGTATTADLIQSIEKKKRGIEAALSRSKNKLNPVEIAQLKKKVYEYRDMQRQAALAQIDFQDGLETAFDDFAGAGVFSSVDRKLNAARARYADVMASPDLGYRDRADAAVKLILAQREAFAAQVENASPTEALRLLNEGFQVDPKARKTYLSALIRDNEAVQNYLDSKSKSPVAPQDENEARGDLINEAIALIDEHGADQVLAYLKAQLEGTEEFLQSFAGGKRVRNPAYDRIQAFIAAIEADPSGIGNIGDEETKRKKNLELLKSIAGGQTNLRKSELNGDPVAQAREDLRAAENDLALIKALTPKDTVGIDNAQAAINNARNALSEAVKSDAQQLADAAAAVARAKANGDPIKEAAATMQAALVAAKYATTEAEKLQAQAGLIDAANQQQDAANDIAAAKGEYLAELASGDPIAAARQALANADREVATAKGSAAQWRAMAARLAAQRALRNAIVDAFVAQKEVAIAVAEGAGETVKVALLQLQIAQQRFNEARSQGVKGAELDRLRAEVIRQQTNVTNTQRNDRLGDLEYLYEFDKLTANSYIALLQAELKKIPESNKEARRAIERRIKALRDEMSADLTTNLPSEIKLPLLYEARRLNQTSQISNMASSYTDARIGSVTIIIPDAGSPEATAKAIADGLSAASRSSPTGSPGILVGIGG